MTLSRPRGAWTALVTPFADGRLDLPSLERLVDWQVAEGIDGLVACGCTGEAATLGRDEHLEVVRTVLRVAAGRVPVIAGTGKNDTAATVELSRAASSLGVDGILVITPYYNKPTAEGQVEHYRAVADAVECPVMVYNVPGRTGTNMTPGTLALLAEHPRIVAVKDAAGAVERVTAIRSLCGMSILSGDDHLALAAMALGAEGVVSVLSNLAPADTARMAGLALEGDFVRARAIHERLFPLMNALFLESNPIPVKQALAITSRIRNELRLPLTPMRQDLTGALRLAMEQAGIA
jgi:4-hydroxy-tetrahydrodipicolinate synthase